MEARRGIVLLLNEAPHLVPRLASGYMLPIVDGSFETIGEPVLEEPYGGKQNFRAMPREGGAYVEFAALAVKPKGFTRFIPHPDIRHEFVLPGYTLIETEIQEGATITHCSLDFAYAAPEDNSGPFASCRGRFETLEELLSNPLQPRGAYHERHNHHSLRNGTELAQLWLIRAIKPGQKLTSIDLRLIELVGGSKEFICPVDQYGIPTGEIPKEARNAEYLLIRSLQS